MTNSLQTVLERAQNHRDQALAQSLRAEEAASRAQLQERQLQDYRADYQSRAPAQVGHSTSIELITCHQAFMQRLDQAVAQQSARREQLQQGAAAQREALLALELHVAAITRLMQRRRAQAAQTAQRQEQRQSDEWVQNRRLPEPSAQGALL
jgi:flagellar protein FliJ